MKGGDCVIRVDADKLKEIVKRRGFANFEAVAEEAGRRNLGLGMATIYNIASNNNWTRDKLEALCLVLDCDPRDFIYFERNGSYVHTHAAPQPAKEIREQIAA
jgi:DNA-binding Xre family transcriptional regulator